MRVLTAIVMFAAGVALVLGTSARSHSTPPGAGYSPQTYAAPVVVPYYGATYGGEQGATKAQASEMLDLLRKIEQNTRAGVGPQAAPKRGPELLAVAKQRCAACHTESKSEAKGGGFILFADETAKTLKPLSAREKSRVKEAVQGGTMPPNAKLTADEKSAFAW